MKRSFLGLANEFSLKLSMVLEAHAVLHVNKEDFWKKTFFVPKMGKVEQKWSKNRVF